MTSWLFLPSLNARLTAVPRSIYMDPALKQITLMQHHQSCKANEYDWICKYAKKSWFKKKNHKPPKKTWRLKFENLRFFIDKEHIMGKKKTSSPTSPLHWMPVPSRARSWITGNHGLSRGRRRREAKSLEDGKKNPRNQNQKFLGSTKAVVGLKPTWCSLDDVFFGTIYVKKVERIQGS